MVNINKIKELAKSKGIKIGFICSELGFTNTYLNDIEKGKSKKIHPDTIHKIARILGTTYDYLTDLTDDPDPNYAAKNAESPDERLIHKFITLVPQLSPEQMGTMEQILDSSEEELDRILSVVKAMRNN